MFQSSQIFLRSFDVPTNDLFLVVARGKAISYVARPRVWPHGPWVKKY